MSGNGLRCWVAGEARPEGYEADEVCNFEAYTSS